MWEDFMRGNWPAVAAVVPDSSSSRQQNADKAVPKVRHAAPRTHATVASAAASVGIGAETRAEARARVPRRHRKLTVKLAIASSATLLGGALLPAIALAGGAASTTAAASGPAGASGTLVALGDSYAAGNLIPESPVGSPSGCLRSTHNYSADAARALHVTHYVDAACTGAKLADMTAPEPVTLGTDPPQLNALSAADSVVTLTIGGNDIGFAQILLTCGVLSVTKPWGDPCARHYTSGGTDRIAAAISSEAPRVGALLRSIRARAPQARVLLVGYPDLLPNTGHGCFPVVPFAHGDVPYLRGTEIKLNQMLASQASANGATYVDTYTATIGHDACASASKRDVEGVIPTSPAYPFHPNQRGQQVMANRVLAALGAT